MINFKGNEGIIFNFRAVAVVIDEGFILLHKSNKDNFWSLPGGRVEFGEKTEEAVIRELKEEVNIKGEIVRQLWYVEEFDKAHEINSQVVGWIFIDGTNINYPIMHGEEDQYYLTHNWKGEPYWNGSIFLDHANSGFNNVSLINGHNMLNGIMFTQLTNFENKDFFNGNHDIYIYNGIDKKLEKFKAIGAIYCEPTIDLSLGNLSTEERTAEVNRLLSKSMYPKEDYNGNDVLLLNTCLSNGSGKHILVITEQVN